MNKVFFLFFILLGLVSCKNEYELEDKLCDCYREQLTSQQLDFDELLNSFEEEYVKKGRFLEKSGDAYYDNSVKFADSSGKYPYIVSDSMVANLMAMIVVMSQPPCSQLANDWKKESKFLSFRNKIIEEVNRSDKGRISELNTWQFFIEFLKPDDFEHPFFKSYYFINDFFSNNSDAFFGIGPMLPYKEVPPSVEKSNANYTLNVELTSNDELIVDSELTDMEDLKEKVLWFYTANSEGEVQDAAMPSYSRVDSVVCLAEIERIEKDPKPFEKIDRWKSKMKLCAMSENGFFYEIDRSAVIKISTHAGTTYGVYIELQNVIKQAINELRVDACKEYGFPDYYTLREDRAADMEIIQYLRVLVPERILESKITN